MYSSLDQADIVLKAGADGRESIIQTDHRPAAEIDKTPYLSGVFAITRILNAKRLRKSGGPEPAVVCFFESDPPVYLRKAISAAGGLVTVGKDALLAKIGEPSRYVAPAPGLGDVIQFAIAGLAQAVKGEFGVGMDAAGLATVERALSAEPCDPIKNESGYWTVVVKLGCFAGEIIRTTNGGRWMVVETGTLPLALATTLNGAPATVNPLGKAMKRFANGEEDRVSTLVDVFLSQIG